MAQDNRLNNQEASVQKTVAEAESVAFMMENQHSSSSKETISFPVDSEVTDYIINTDEVLSSSSGEIRTRDYCNP